MIEYYSTVKENGWEYAKKTARELEERGYEVLDIREAVVPRGENADGKVYYVPGYEIVVDDGREPRYKGYVQGKFANDVSLVNENLQDPPGVNPKPFREQPQPSGVSISETGYPVPWLW